MKSLFHTKKTNTHLYYSHHFISTLLLQHVSGLKGPSSGSMTDTFSKPDPQIVYPIYNSLYSVACIM